MAIFDNLIGVFADLVLANIGEAGYAILLWIINLLLWVELPVA